MRKVIILAFLLCGLFVSKANAAAIIPAAFQEAAYCGTPGTSCNTGVVSPAAQVGDGITVCVSNWAGTAATGQAITINGSSTGISAWGTRFAQSASVIACFTKTLVAGDPGSTIHATWTNNNQGEVFEAIWHPSDDVAVTFETPSTHGCATAATCTPNSVTPSQNGDQVFFECVTTTGSGAWTGAGTFTQAWAQTGIIAGNFGWSASSGFPTMPVGNSGSGTPDMACFTGAVKASGAGSVVVSAGAEAFNSGSVTNTTPQVSGNAHSSDVSFAGIAQIGAVGKTITTLPGDIQLIYKLPQVYNSGSNTFTTTGTGVQVGDVMTVLAVWIGLPPSSFNDGAGHSFTQVCNDTSLYQYYAFQRVATASDVSGATYTLSIGGVQVSDIFTIYRSATGATISVDGASACSHTAITTAPAAPVIVTGTNNEACQVSVTGQFAGNPPAPSDTFQLYNDGQRSDGMYYSPTAGSTPAQVFSGGSNQVYLTAQVCIAGAGTGSPWRTVSGASKSNEQGTIQVDVLEAPGLPPNAYEPFFISAGTSLNSAVVNVGGLNTSTPVDGAVGALGLEGMSNNVAMAVLQPTANDDLALVFDGFATCSPGQPQNNQVLTNVADGQNRMAVDYESIDYAMTNHITESSICPYVSIAIPLQAASAPAQTAAAIRLQQQVEEIWSLAPAPSPPAPASNTTWQLYISRNDPEWILAAK